MPGAASSSREPHSHRRSCMCGSPEFTSKVAHVCRSPGNVIRFTPGCFDHPSVFLLPEVVDLQRETERLAAPPHLGPILREHEPQLRPIPGGPCRSRSGAEGDSGDATYRPGWKA